MGKGKKRTGKVSRPPVVAIMGHVDHGKTTLLDYIRHSHVTKKEHGGITQHITAYQVEFQGKKITFVDTPGHAAFEKMRARGAHVTDLALLVVAANDGVKPQTIEAIAHIQKEKIPMIIAINKIDLQGANIDLVKQQLAENQVFVEGYGGDIVVAPVSAKTGEGVENLLEMILLVAEMEELYADPKKKAELIVIDSRIDTKRGVVASIIVQNGTLHIGDEVILGKNHGKIRAIIAEDGKMVQSAGPSTPVEILGLKNVPEIGETTKKEERSKGLSELLVQGEVEKLKVVLRTDTIGSLEAVVNSLPEEVEVIHSGTGEITDSDVLLAHTGNSLILGLHIKATSSAKKLSATEKVEILLYTVIYELLDEVRDRVRKMKEPERKEETIGQAKVIASFDIKEDKIIGCKVIEGNIQSGSQVRLMREDEEIGVAKIKSLKYRAKDMKRVEAGSECGILLDPQLDFSVGDMIVSYRI